MEALAPVERQVFMSEYKQEIKDREEQENEGESNSRLLGDPLDYS